MVYVPQTWENLPAKNTPISAERLNHMEAGIANSGTGFLRVDETIGKTVFARDKLLGEEVMVYGITPWRAIHNRHTNGATSQIRIRRTTDSVELIVTGKPDENKLFGRLPAGYLRGWTMMPVAGFAIKTNGDTEPAFISLQDENVQLNSSADEVNFFMAYAFYSTTDDWPTELPGVSVSYSDSIIPE